MTNQFNLTKVVKIILSGILGVLIIAFFSFQTFSKQTQAQTAYPPLSIVCKPNQNIVLKDSTVTWTATVLNASSTISYVWGGESVLNRNQATTTAKYSSIGQKTATLKVTSKGVVLSTDCKVTVLEIPNIPGGGSGEGNTGGGTGSGSGSGSGSGGTGSGSGSGGTGSNPGSGSGSGSNPNQPGGGTGNGSNPGSDPNNPNNNPNGEEKDPGTFTTDDVKEDEGNQSSRQQDEKKCEEEDAQNSNAKSMREELQKPADPNKTQQQMVPTNPIPIVTPIENIEKNIAILTEKEIGRADTQDKTPSLDAVSNCKVDVSIKVMIEKSTNFIYKGNADNPTFVINYTKHFTNIQDKAFEQAIKKLQESKSCSAEEEKNIAKELVRIRNSESLVNKESKEQCSAEQSGDDKYDLNSLENFLNQTDPRNSALFKHFEIALEVDDIITSNTKVLAYETEIAQGHLNITDPETGNIVVPATHYLPQALEHMTLAIKRFVTLDETGEDGKIIEDYFNKVYQMSEEASDDDGSGLGNSPGQANV